MLSQVPIHHEIPNAQGVETGERERKRRRKALSCYDCRRRKLKCDRNFPSCSRCSRAGQASKCRYETDPSEARNGQLEDSASEDEDENSRARLGVSKGDADSTGRQMASEPSSKWPQNRKISQLENRIANMEEALANQTSTALRSRELEVTRPADSRFLDGFKRVHENETMIFRKESFKTQYYGATNDMAPIASFPEFIRFIKDPTTDQSSFMRARQEMGVLKARRKVERAAALAKIDGDLFSLLPSQEVTDDLVRLYFDTVETTYRILHQPTFWQEYQQFWLDPKSNPSFIALILLTIAIVRCISAKEPRQYIGDSTKERETSILHIAACDFWLRKQSIKHATIHTFQVHCLLILAKLANLIKEKQAWTSTGTSLRFFMSAGLHRDPDLLYGGHTSEFDKEMRRRLWNTMAELELDASVTRGMPTALAGFRTDCGRPKNINDQDLDQTSAKLPDARPSDEFTSTSFLCLSHNSLSLRIELMCAANSTNLPLPYEDVLQYEEKIMQQLQLLPHWSDGSPAMRRDSALLEAMLDIQLRQFLIILHGPFARRSHDNPQYGYSRMVCFNAASSIVEQHSKHVEAGLFALSVLRNDLYRVAMCLCQNVYMSNLIIPKSPSIKILTTSSTQLIEEVLDLLGQRALMLGRGYKYFVFLSGAYGVALSRTTDKPLVELKRDAVDRAVKIFSKVVFLQCDTFQPFLISDGHIQTTPHSNTGSTPRDGRASVGGTPYFGVQTPFPGGLGIDEQFFDYNLPGWNVEDFWAFDAIPETSNTTM